MISGEAGECYTGCLCVRTRNSSFARSDTRKSTFRDSGDRNHHILENPEFFLNGDGFAVIRAIVDHSVSGSLSLSRDDQTDRSQARQDTLTSAKP